MTLPDSLRPLLSPRAYPHPVQAVQLIETHISWILLSGQIAYKIKRPVALPFVDLRSAEHREYLCHEEVRLNRRFAPDLYLGVCKITAGEHGAMFDGAGPVIEHAVRMLQFERREELDVLLESHRIGPGELGEFGRELARLHSGLPTVPPNPAWGRPEAVREVILRNLDESIEVARGFADATKLHALREPLGRRLEAAAPWMAERSARGKIRECHGDLHCSNIVRRQSRLLAFDCLEFEPAFRWIDVADEIAFLLCDLDSRNRPAHAQAFLGGYLEQSGDHHACRFLDLYKAHRSLVRAKVAVLSAAGSADPQAISKAHERYDTHIRRAYASLAPQRPLLILMSGLSGSGKTWLATRLALPFGAVHLRSDIERKRLAGLSARERSGSPVGAGLYSSEMSARLQRQLLDCAESTLAGGYTTLVDATFARREDRRRFIELGGRLRVNTCLIHCHAPVEVLRARIEDRARQGGDPSEADLAVLEWQQRHYEPVQADEALDVFEASSDDPGALGWIKRYIASRR
jgi:aminoglycoside phosphotransferase family enzyme/predicted kinase